MSNWWKFDNDNDDECGDAIEQYERAALDAIRAIVALADTQPDQALIAGA